MTDLHSGYLPLLALFMRRFVELAPASAPAQNAPRRIQP